MTDKEERFVSEYVVDLDEVRAAMVSHGVKYGHGWRVAKAYLEDPAVAAAIKVKLDVLAKSSQVSAEWVRARLKENVERSMQAKPVLDKDGEHTGEWQYNGAVANKALELLGKHLGMYQDKVVVTIEDELKGLTPEELERRLLSARAAHTLTVMEMNPMTGAYETVETQALPKKVNPVEEYENA